MKDLSRLGSIQSHLLVPSRGVWFALAVAAIFAAIALTPGADPTQFSPGTPNVVAAASPNPLWLQERATAPLDSIKGTALKGTAYENGPSANIGQTLQFKGTSLAPGEAIFQGYDGGDDHVSTPLFKVKAGKKGKGDVPLLAVTGDVFIMPTGSTEVSNPIRLQIVPTLDNISDRKVAPGMAFHIDGSGFDTQIGVFFPGIAEAIIPDEFDDRSADFLVPEGFQKGKIQVATTGGLSNASKKVKPLPTAKVLANRALATDPATGYLLATDDVRNTVDVIDPVSGATLHATDLGFEPWRIELSANARRAIVRDIEENGEYAVIDLATWAVVRRGAGLLEEVMETPSVLFDPNRGRLLAPTTPGRKLGQAVEPLVAIPVAMRIEALSVSADGRRAVVVAGDRGVLFVVDLTRHVVLSTHQFDGPIEGVTIGLDGRAYTIDRRTGRLLSIAIE